jgi:hypothetical protein
MFPILWSCITTDENSQDHDVKGNDGGDALIKKGSMDEKEEEQENDN